MSKQTTDDGSFSRTAWRLSGLGIEFVAGIAGFGLIGWLIDQWRGTMPLWTLIGAALGLIGGGYNFMRQAIKAGRAADAEYRRKHPPQHHRPSEPDEGSHEH